MIPFYRIFYSWTPKIKDSTGKIKRNSVASLEKIDLNGVKQCILVRGHDTSNPVLLFLHGGPGSPEMGIAYYYQRRLEEHFTVVNWDQRGAGKSYSRKVPIETLNTEQYISDTFELVQLLLTRFNKKKIFLVGHSWGSILGSYVVQRYPELFHAYVGIGQVANMIQNERISFEFVYEQAKKAQDEKAIKKLEEISPYTGKNRKAMHIQRKLLAKYHGGTWKLNGEKEFIKQGFGSPEYNILDYYKFIKGASFTSKAMLKELMEFDLFKDVPVLKVPVFICQGRHDYQTPFELAKQWFDQLQAPKKEFIWFEESAHSPNLEEPEKFDSVLIDAVLKENIKAVQIYPVEL